MENVRYWIQGWNSPASEAFVHNASGYTKRLAIFPKRDIVNRAEYGFITLNLTFQLPH
jgi:hypothetical protein